jgi:hypothetical protein
VGDGGLPDSEDYPLHGDPVPPPEMDVAIARPPRIYDFLLGGKDNYAGDRAVAEQTRGIEPEVVVAYVDNDPIVLDDDRALLAVEPGVVTVLGDLTGPPSVLGAPQIDESIGWSRPVGVIVDPTAWRPTQVPPTETEGAKQFLAGVGLLPRR